jgi:FkbM family methyltransferase
MKRQPWFWPIKLFFKRVSGRELWLSPDIDRETLESESWRYVADGLDENSVVYSLGVGDSIDFDLDVIRRFGLTVHAFDPTPFAQSWVRRQALPANFIFHPWAAASEDGGLRLYRRVNTRGRSSAVMWTADRDAGDPNDFIDSPAYTLQSIMDRLGHASVDLVKMDVEGAEFDILDGLERARSLPRQLLVEFHHRFPGIGKQRTADCIARLRQYGYRIFAISETGREVGFLLES